MDGETSPDLTGFRGLAKRDRVIPVSRTLLADGLTPVGLFEALCGKRAGTFLLESAEAGRSWSRYSFVGVRSAAMLTEVDGRAHWAGRVPAGLPKEGSAWDVLGESARMLHTPHAATSVGPRLTSGFIGYLSYDCVRHFERLPDENPPIVDIPEMAFLLATDIAVLDHFRGTVTLIANAINYDASDERIDDAWREAYSRLDRMESELAMAPQSSVVRVPTAGDLEFESHTSEADYLRGVGIAKDYITAGDAFQIVLSQRYSMPVKAEGLDVYRVLRSSNPSPYMYLIRIPINTGQTSEV
ncbi:MAG TPA: chorismate-binding protein, partial [Acidimicrobiia bacterium]